MAGRIYSRIIYVKMNTYGNFSIFRDVPGGAGEVVVGD